MSVREAAVEAQTMNKVFIFSRVVFSCDIANFQTFMQSDVDSHRHRAYSNCNGCTILMFCQSSANLSYVTLVTSRWERPQSHVHKNALLLKHPVISNVT